MSPPGEALHHRERGFEIGGFAEDLALENHLRVHAEDQRVGMFPRHGLGLRAGIAQDDFPRREMERRAFLHVRRLDGKGVTVLTQKLPPARRGGGENQGREHGSASLPHQHLREVQALDHAGSVLVEPALDLHEAA